MYVCEHEFREPDPREPQYSLVNIDFYAWIPPEAQRRVKNHLLSLRKNLSTGEYEVFRVYSDRTVQVIHRSKTLGEILLKANEEWNKFHEGWGGHRDPDEVCEHKPPRISLSCPVGR